MTIGSLSFELNIPEAFSLKDKRRILKSLKDRIKNKFNVSVAEVGHKDIWNRALLVVVNVSDSSVHVDKQLSEVVNFVEQIHDISIIQIKLEIF
jgi:uncharacterized protein YlxP (DUF503 family)